MASEWKERVFRDLLMEPVRNGIYKPSEFHGRGTKVINMGELFAYPRLRSVEMKRVELTESESERFSVHEGDLLFARRSLVAEGAGKCCIVLEVNEPTTFESSLIRARVDNTKANSGFLFYLFSSPLGAYHLDTILRHVAVAGITGRDLMGLHIKVPDPDTQEEIARVLAVLDDKIELNRKMNETLEAMARALFKSWFVDFDPVRAKVDCRDTRLPDSMSALLPDSLVESTLGEIPTGWTVEPIGNLTEVIGGTTPSTKEEEFWTPETHAWVTPKDLSNLRSPVLLGTERRISDKGLAQIGSGLLPVGTVLLSSRAPIGYLAVAEVPVAINQGFIAMKARKGVSSLFLLYWAEVAQELIKSHANGSTFLEISKSNFRQIEVVRPASAIMAKFDGYVRPWYERIVMNERESASLTATRDALLPKLISGEIRVKPKSER
ncbi:MAG: restriction endonuclease subunit S [Terracidiphilus sp.]